MAKWVDVADGFPKEKKKEEEKEKNAGSNISSKGIYCLEKHFNKPVKEKV